MCFGGWDVELSPRDLVSEPVMEVIEVSTIPTMTNYQGMNLNFDPMFSNMSFQIDFGITADMMMPTKTPSKERWTTTTTTVVTPGIDTTAQAMAVKEVADNLLGAAGFVTGGTLGIFYGSPYLGATTGEATMRTIGAGMWNLIN